MSRLTERRLRLARLEPQYQALSLDRDALQNNVKDLAAKADESEASDGIAAATNDNIRIVQRAQAAAAGQEPAQAGAGAGADLRRLQRPLRRPAADVHAARPADAGLRRPHARPARAGRRAAEAAGLRRAGRVVRVGLGWTSLRARSRQDRFGLHMDLSAEMARALGVARRAAGRPRGSPSSSSPPRDGEGVSTVAREFAFRLARHDQRRVWLIDLDLMGQAQAAGARRRCGALRPARPGRAGHAPTARCSLRVQPPLARPDGRPWPDARYIGAHSVGGPGLWVTRFRREALRPHQGVHVTPTPDYWTALRSTPMSWWWTRRPPSARRPG